jgi:hypothetical protein
MVEAFKSGFVPNHLHGRTQHKTLQARLSENILKQREQSAFFRTSPGRFFLREFLSDERLPVNFRTPIIARRRVRDLPKKGLLAVKRSEVEAVLQDGDLKDGELHDFFKTNRLRYLPTRHEATTDDVLVWSFVVILRGEKVLSYRQGRYREGRDTFLQKRSIGFYSLVTGDDFTLFDQDDYGVLSSGLKAISMDLDLPIASLQEAERISQSGFVYTLTEGRHDLLGLIKYECPEWFEPLGRRLSLNDLNWLDATLCPNNTDDFDPWSQLILERVRTQLIADDK